MGTHNLVEQWSSADFISSATTLSLSSTSFPHGSPINASVTVTSTVGTPSGDVSFNGGVPNGSVGFATLSGGSVQTSLNNLPGGSYNVVAHYGGSNDGTNIFAGSDSNPVAVTVAPEASTTTMTSVFYNVNGGSYAPGTTATFGAYLILPRADVAGVSSKGIATGTVTFTANGSPLTGSPFTLNSLGNTKDINFPGNAGTYMLSASYSGDPSFNPSTGTSILTITQQTPTATLTSSASNVTAGISVTFNAVFNTTTYFGYSGGIFVSGAAPTGNVTFYTGTTSLGAVAIGTGDYSGSFPVSLATTALPVGVDSITAVYGGDINYAAVTSPAVAVTVTAAPPLVIYGTAIAAIPAGTSGTSTVSVTPSPGFTGAVNLTCAVMSPSGAASPPTCSYSPASVTISATETETSTLTITTTPATTVESYSVTIGAADAATGNITAQGMLPFTVLEPSIALTFSPTAITISTQGQLGTSYVTVTPTNYLGTLNLTCVLATGPSGANSTYNPTCTLPSPRIINCSGCIGYASLATIATAAPTIGERVYPETNRRTNRWYRAAGGAALACVLFFGIPARCRSWKSMLSLLIFLVALAGGGCGWSNGDHISTAPGTTVGNYTFTVTATDPMASSITATGTISVTVN